MRKLKLLGFIFTATVGALQWQGRVPNFRKPGYHLECYKCDNAGKEIQKINSLSEYFFGTVRWLTPRSISKKDRLKFE